MLPTTGPATSPTGFLGRCCDALMGHEPVTGITIAGGSTPALVSAKATTVALPALDNVRDYLELGVEHIFTGYDHLAFLLGLLLIAAGRGAREGGGAGLRYVVGDPSKFVAPLDPHMIESNAPRRVLHELNQLHLNEPKRVWTYVADLYALSLILLAITGLFVLKGKYGITGRGGWLTAVGALIPLGFWLAYLR